MCVACARLYWRDLALISIIIRTKDAQASTDRPSPTVSTWAFVLVTTLAVFRLLSTSVQLHVCLGTHLALVCQVADHQRLIIRMWQKMAGSSLGALMKPRPWLIGDTMAWGNERGSYQASGRKGGCSSSFPHTHELGLSCSFVEHAGENTYTGLIAEFCKSKTPAADRRRDQLPFFHSSFHHIFKALELTE